MAIEVHEEPAEWRDTSEETPLLGEQAQNPPSEARTAKSLYRRVILLVFLSVAAVDAASYLQSIPRVRLYEIAYCRQYYDDVNPGLIGPGGVVDEDLCKVNIVQSQVAFLIGWMGFFDYAPGIFLAVPFGMLADKYGRKNWLALNMLSFALREAWIYLVLSFPTIFPIRLVWLEAVFILFGGGSMVATSLICVVCNDVTPQSKLSVAFNRLDAMKQTSLIITTLITARLMKVDPWIPVTLGLGVQFLAVPLAFFIPETLNLPKEQDEGTEDSQQPSGSTLSTSSNDLTRSSTNSADLQKPRHALSPASLQRYISSALAACAFLFQNWRILFIAATYPPRMADNDLDVLLVQYIPKRWHWTLADTNFVWSLEAACNTAVNLLLMPFVSNLLLTSFAYSATGKDILLSRFALLMNAVFILAQGLAPTAWAFVVATVGLTLGSGGGASMRALMTSYVKKDEVARLYTFLAIVDTATLMVSGPAVAELFTVGLNKGGVWEGLPWLVIGGLMAVTAVAMFVARLEGGGKKKVVGEGNGGVEEGLERAVGGRGVGAVGI